MNPGNRVVRIATMILLFSVASVCASAQKSALPPATKTEVRAAVSAAARRLAWRVNALLARAPADQASWGILVVDGKTGEKLYARNEDRLFIPASNMKLFTTAMALATLGPSYRFRTTLETQGALDKEDGRLEGDLVLVGRGDPNLSNRKFPFVSKPETDGPPEKVLAELADEVVARGVKDIVGDIVADDSYFPPERYPSGWEMDDAVWQYGAAVSAIAVDDNTTLLTLTPGASQAEAVSAAVEPETDDFALENDVTTGPPLAPGARTASEKKDDLVLIRDPGERLVVVRGTLPAGSPPRTLVLAIEQPAEHAAAMLKRLLEERGVKVEGDARAQHVEERGSGGRTVLAQHLSPPLGEALQPVNKMSLNLHAEMLLRAAARLNGLWTKPEELTDFARQFYRAAGVADRDLLFTDGSGLSRSDLVTPRALVTLLRYARRQPWFPAYFASLPVAGEDGTLADRMKGTKAAGRVHAKTGSHEHAAVLSGYAEIPGDREIVFSILANNAASAHDAANTIDAICAALFGELGRKPRK
jgi:D-alanyl-D-alanine carboxypeptidase/D-alanyl-D-alanine-endopeptidase (penicillin-binding protein 4)